MSLVNRDNTFWLTLGMFGELPLKEEIERLLNTSLDSIRRKDATSRGKLAISDVATLRLAEWDGDEKSREVFVSVISMLQNWIPVFHHMKTTYRISFSVSLSAFRETDLGGIEFPDDFLRVLVEAQIAFGISIQARFLWAE